MKIGFTSLTLKDKSPEEVVRSAKEANLQGIEWGVSSNHIDLGDLTRARQVGELCEHSGIDVFSLGSYCKMEEQDDLEKTVLTAEALGAPVIRVWAGTKSPDSCTEEYINRIVTNSAYMADLAAKHNISLGFEFHGGTLTETAIDALKFIRSVDRENAGLYWQPDFTLSSEQNILSRDIVLPYCIGNMHVQNYTPEHGYGNLAEIENTLRKYYYDIKDKPYKLMIEFVKESSVENLIKDAQTLQKIIYA